MKETTCSHSFGCRNLTAEVTYCAFKMINAKMIEFNIVTLMNDPDGNTVGRRTVLLLYVQRNLQLVCTNRAQRANKLICNNEHTGEAALTGLMQTGPGL